MGTVKIQSAYRGFKTRKQMKESGEDLHDLRADDVVAATIKIQSAYKGFQARKMIKQHKEMLPDLNCAQVQDATIKIQSAYKGFKVRKNIKEQQELKAKQEAELRAKQEIREKQEAVRKAKQDAIRARKIKEKAHPKEPMVQRQKQETKPQVSNEPVRTRQRHESKQQIPDTKRQQEMKKEQEAKIKKDTVGFFGRFIPGAGSKASEVEEKKPVVQNENKPSYNKQKLSESSPLAKTTGVSKGDTSDVKKGSHQKTVIPLEGTIKRKPKKQQVEEDLPDLKAADVAK